MVSMVSQAALAEAGLVLIILFRSVGERHVKVAAVPFEKVTPCGVVRFLKIEFFGYETIDVMYRVEFFNQGTMTQAVYSQREKPANNQSQINSTNTIPLQETNPVSACQRLFRKDTTKIGSRPILHPRLETMVNRCISLLSLLRNHFNSCDVLEELASAQIQHLVYLIKMSSNATIQHFDPQKSNYCGEEIDSLNTNELESLKRRLLCYLLLMAWMERNADVKDGDSQSSMAMSSAVAEYVAAVSAIAISNNPVLHSRTKHIDMKYHFMRDHILKGDIELHFVPTDLQLANIFTKPLAEPSFTRLVAELDTASKPITFTLLQFDKPLSFDLDTFSSVIGLDRSDELVDIPPKETVKAGLATLGLVDEDHPSLSSSDLINSSLVKVKYFSPTWKGLNIDIADILFSDLIAHLYPEGSKNQRKPNVCYTRYLSLIMENLLQDIYKNDKLLSLKPFNITTNTFKPTWKNETALTSHMCKVADLSPEPIQSLIPPSEEVNADVTADKSSSGTFVPPVTQLKAPIAKRQRKKKMPSLTQPEVLKSSRIVKSSSTQATHLQPAEEFVVIVDATKVLDQNIMEEEDAGVRSLEEPTFEQIMDEVDKQSKAAQEEPESPYDTESEIKIVKSFKSSWFMHPEIDQTNDANITFMGSGPINMELDDTSSNLHLIPCDDLASLTRFETHDSANEGSNYATKEHSSGNLNATSDGDIALPNASAGLSALSDPLGHLQRKLTTISSKVDQLESCITKNVSKELKSYVPTLVSDALKETLPGLLANALKASIPSLIQESVQNTVQQSIGEQTSAFQAQAHQTLEEQLDRLIYKPMNKQFYAFNKLESQRFVYLEKELSKCIKTKLSKSVSERVRTGMQYVNKKLSSVQDAIAHNTQRFNDMRAEFKIMNFLLEAAKKINVQGEHSITQENTDTALVVHQLGKENSEFPNPTPLRSIILEHLLNPLEQKLSVEQFTNQLFGTTSSNFAPSPPREPTPPRDPSKGKGVSTEEPMKELIPYIEEGGSDPNMLNMKPLAEKEESEKALMRIMNPVTVKAQTLKLANMRRKGQRCLM
ncbi:hypothetical protein Tco_0812316 [Tanacetum coccineum]